MTPRPHCVRVRLTDAERATLGRALDLSGATPRALLLVAASATCTDTERVSAVVRAAEQRDGRDLARALESLRAVAASRKGARLSAGEASSVLAAPRMETKP